MNYVVFLIKGREMFLSLLLKSISGNDKIMRKYIGIVVLAFVFAANYSSAQVARPDKADRAARKEEKREMKNNNKLQNSDRKKDRKLQKEEDRAERREDKRRS